MRLWDAIRWLFRRPRRQRLLESAAPVVLLAAPQVRPALALPSVICLPDLSVVAPTKLKLSRPRKQTARLKADVLEQLDRYQVYIKRLKKWSPDLYAQYRRIGAFVCYHELTASALRLEPEIIQILPAFGALTFDLTYESETPDPDSFIGVKFACFTKLERPGNDVERVNTGVTYRLHVYWDDALDKMLMKLGRDRGVGHDFLVNIAADGTIRALRVLRTQTQVLKVRQAQTVSRLTTRGRVTTRKSHASPEYVTHQRWGLPVPLWQEGTTGDTAAHIRQLFCLIVNFWHQNARHSMIRVTATKGNIVMPFIVDATDTPQFFSDREPVVIDGVTKRIFHIVRPHVRQTKSGPKGIRMHFSGLRQFAWNGYRIGITVPGRDHLDVAEFPVGALEDVPEEEQGGMIQYHEAADWLADQIGAPGKEAQAAVQ